MRALPLLLLACTAAASPREFEVTVTTKQGPEALARLADLRCGGKAERAHQHRHQRAAVHRGDVAEEDDGVGHAGGLLEELLEELRRGAGWRRR